MTEIHLDDSVDISRVGLLYDQLSPFPEGVPSITLDLSDITHVDCAGIQLIYAFTESARKQGIEVMFKQPSDVFLTAAKTLGLAGYFEPV